MNDDFEKKLLGLAGALRRPDPTAGWKGEILARARQEARGARRPPRLLMAAWAIAWAAIVLLTVSTPRGADRGENAALAGTRAVQRQDAVALDGGRAGTPALLAFGRQENLTGELP